MKRIIYCFFATVICLALICGCQPTPPRRTDSLFAPFCAEITGELNGVSFSALLVGEGGEGAVEIAYLTPDALSGVRVRAPLNADGGLGEAAELSLGELSMQLPTEAAEGLLLPARILFRTRGRMPQRCKRRGRAIASPFPTALRFRSLRKALR